MNTQTIDPTSPNEKICVSGSLISTQIAGKYHFLSWNSSINASIYYNNQTQTYLYPVVNSVNNYQYIISSSPNNKNTASSMCNISESSSHYIFNPSDCFKNWRSKVNNTWINDEDMRLVNCNDLCIIDNYLNNKTYLDGTYVWLNFNLSTKSSIYYCQQCNNYYLYGWIYSNGYQYWLFGPDYRSWFSWMACYVGRDLATNYIFHLEDCIEWKYWNGDAWFYIFRSFNIYKCDNYSLSPKQVIAYKEQMCVSGSMIPSINGIYEYDSHSNGNGSIYHNPNTNKYLYPWIYSDTKKYLISNHPLNNVSIASCNIQSATNAFNFDDCFANWMANINDPFVQDTELRVVSCNDICVTGNMRPGLDGTYKWIKFNRTKNASIYQHNNVYLYGWIWSSGNREWRISHGYTTNDRYSYCNLSYPGDGYIFNIDDCTKWKSWNQYEDKWLDDDMKAAQCLKPPIESTSNPTIFYGTTVEPSFSPSATPFAQTIYIIVIIAIFIFCILTIIILCVFLYWKKRQKNNYDPIQPYKVNKKLINNGLAVMIGIGDYEHEDINDSPDIDGYLRDLPVDKDIENFRKLCKLLNYKIIPNEFKIGWTEEEVIKYLKYDIGKELFDDNKTLKYDSLIVCISCHGIENKIITSDSRTIEKNVVHRIISMEYPKTRNIPRIFIFDSCEGSSQREYLKPSSVDISRYDPSQQMEEKKESISEQKNDTINVVTDEHELEKGTNLQEISTGYEWTHNTQNPDYLLAQIHAANIGFQAKCHSIKGSYLIYEFVQKMISNIMNNENQRLGEVFGEIQNKLHDSGKQQTINIFNNGTENVVFVKNTQSQQVNNETDVELQELNV